MSLPANPKAILQDVIRQGHAVIVSGTGVSIAASQFHPQASWTGLLDNGLSLLGKHGLITDDQAKAHRQLLSSSPATAQFIATAQAITSEMSQKMFRSWLKDTVGGIKAKDAQVLDVLEDMRQLKNLLATTNYDGLLLEGHTGLVPITWHDKAAFLSAYRNRDHDKVLFLHGYWDVPESVILDERSYQDIARDKDYRDKLAAVWLTSTWIYVGCGESGLTDPDLGLLLDVYGQQARDDGHWDFLLALKKDVARLQDFFNKQGVNICVVGYGDKHTDLVPFLRSLLPPPASVPPVPVPTSPPITPPLPSTLPHPPAFYAKPDYIGRHDFVGRTAQLQVLTDWAKATDSTSILLFEAIGGNGKSMLTWEWTTKHAEEARSGHEPWAGRFWYSFYEKGAIMRDFCLHALHYMTQQPMETLEKKSMADLRTALLAQLHARPWLLILDGLERVLVAYHRIDAAEVRDEEVNRPTDKILDRDPCDAIRDDDTELLRALAAAKPSKILISSRLIPRVLLNPSGLPLPGVKPLVLPGLDDADAEQLFCEVCGIRGTSADIRYYLKTFCDNHPLVIGVLAGLINSPGPHRGHFDAWAAAPEYGAKLNLARLDLIQSRNHILRAAMDALEAPSRQLLSTLALLTDAVDYDTVAAFNPHLPPEPEQVGKPEPPEKHWRWDKRTDEERVKLREQYEAALAKRKAYEQAIQDWRDSAAVREAPKKLGETLQDLERRGLVQYDGIMQRYDLHPVVRGVAAGGMKIEDKESYGQRVVDYFNSQPHPPYEQARTMEDVASGLHVVRTLLKLGHHRRAADSYFGDLSLAVHYSLEGHVEQLSLLKPFFDMGWKTLPGTLPDYKAEELASYAAESLEALHHFEEAILIHSTLLRTYLGNEDWSNAMDTLGRIAWILIAQNALARRNLLGTLAVDLFDLVGMGESLFLALLCDFEQRTLVGESNKADEAWSRLNLMGRDWFQGHYRSGHAETKYAVYLYRLGNLRDHDLAEAAALARDANSRPVLRELHRLRGAWRLEQGEWALAAASFDTAVTMAREVRLVDEASESGLALAKHHLGQLTGDAARSEAERLTGLRQPAHRTLAQLWLAIGDRAKAEHHALAAYRWAWADGEPYVNRYELTKTTELLNTLDVPIPDLPLYDPAKDEPFPWEADVRASIEKLKAKKAKKAK